jgi:hypothetical protein
MGFDDSVKSMINMQKQEWFAVNKLSCGAVFTRSVKIHSVGGLGASESVRLAVVRPLTMRSCAWLEVKAGQCGMGYGGGCGLVLREGFSRWGRFFSRSEVVARVRLCVWL